MRASSIIALGAATLAAAAPATSKASEKFNVNKFVFGCTSGCYYTFDLNFSGETAKYECSGSLEDKDYVQCTGAEGSKAYYAYIDTTENKNILKLQYEVSDVKEQTVTRSYGHKQVYAATSVDADKQKKNFSVKVSSKTAIA